MSVSPRAYCCAIGALTLLAGRLTQAATTLLPVADTYLRANQATTAFGTAGTIESNNANGVRVMLLRFDLSAIAQPITGLRLDLTAVTGSAGNQFQVFGLIAGESWEESTVTWATAPGVIQTFTGLTGVLANYLKPADLSGSGTALATFGSAASGIVTAFEVSSGPVLNFVQADADKIVTFLIAEADPSDNSGDRYNSREAATGQPVLTVTTETAPKLIRVVIQAGQSNSDGRAAGSDLPTAPANLQTPQANVPFYFYTFGSAANGDGTYGTLATLRPGGTEFPVGGFGPEVTLGYHLAQVIEQQADTKLAIVKYAKGGSSLSVDWIAGGDATPTGDGAHYQRLQTVVRDGLAKLRATYPPATVQLAGMIWVQGETDLGNGAATAGAYGANLTAFIADVRQTFSPSLPFFFSRISSRQTVYSSPTDPDYANYLTLRARQEQVAASVPNTYLIDTDASSITMNPDNLHFAAFGQQVIGAAFASRMADILRLRTTAFDDLPAGRRLRWNSIPGKSYRVNTSGNLTGWSAQAVGVTGEWTDAASNGLTRRFYRVEEVNDTIP